METGRTVVLLNLENLYESLYDLLNQVSSYALQGVLCTRQMQCVNHTIGLLCNEPYIPLQYYTMFLGSRYVDLGLQSHRIKCRVDEKFK